MAFRKQKSISKKSDLANLIETVATHDVDSIIAATRKTISLYQQLRLELFSTVNLQRTAEMKVLDYFDHVAQRVNKKSA